MDAVTKLLKKMSRRDKERVLTALLEIQTDSLQGIKLTGKNEYRVRVGNYRIIYHLEASGVVIDHVRRRSEDTYK